MVIAVVVVVLLERHLLRCDSGDDRRCHHIASLHIVEAHDVADDLVLVLLNDAFLLANISERYDLLAADGRVVGFGESACDILDKEYEGIHDPDEEGDSP